MSRRGGRIVIPRGSYPRKLQKSPGIVASKQPPSPLPRAAKRLQSERCFPSNVAATPILGGGRNAMMSHMHPAPGRNGLSREGGGGRGGSRYPADLKCGNNRGGNAYQSAVCPLILSAKPNPLLSTRAWRQLNSARPGEMKLKAENEF